MKRKTSLAIGAGMLAAGLCFLGYGLGHPELSFPWGNRVTYMGYGVYLWLLFKFLLDIPVFARQREVKAPDLLHTVAPFVTAFVFLLMELTGTKVDGYTVVRGLIVAGNVDIGLEMIGFWGKHRK